MGKYYVNFVSGRAFEGVFHNERTINWDIYKGFPLFPHLSTWINWGKVDSGKAKLWKSGELFFSTPVKVEKVRRKIADK